MSRIEPAKRDDLSLQPGAVLTAQLDPQLDLPCLIADLRVDCVPECGDPSEQYVLPSPGLGATPAAVGRMPLPGDPVECPAYLHI